MGNCQAKIGSGNMHVPVTLLLVGLDSAGKTTTAKSIVGESLEDVAPTVGFCPESLTYRGCNITLYDLGGGARIRGVWARYYAEVHGVIFVIDASQTDRLAECQQVLYNLLSHKWISGKPLLILANKQDQHGAVDELDLIEALNIEITVNKYKCPTRVETCSAISLSGRKPDKPIAEGFGWLVDMILDHYTKLDERVEINKEEQCRQMQLESEERRKRIMREKRLRSRKEGINRRLEVMTVSDQLMGNDDADVVLEPLQPYEKDSNIANHIIDYKTRASKSPFSKPNSNSQNSAKSLPYVHPSVTTTVDTSSASTSDVETVRSLSPPDMQMAGKHEEVVESLTEVQGHYLQRTDSQYEPWKVNNFVSESLSVPSVPYVDVDQPDQLDLELSFVPPKRRNFLKRYNKTTPANEETMFQS